MQINSASCGWSVIRIILNILMLQCKLQRYFSYTVTRHPVSKFRPAARHPTPWAARGLLPAMHTLIRAAGRLKTSLPSDGPHTERVCKESKNESPDPHSGPLPLHHRCGPQTIYTTTSKVVNKYAHILVCTEYMGVKLRKGNNYLFLAYNLLCTLESILDSMEACCGSRTS